MGERLNYIVAAARRYPSRYDGGVLLPEEYWGGGGDEEHVPHGVCFCLWATRDLLPAPTKGATLSTITGLGNGARFVCGKHFTGESLQLLFEHPATLHAVKDSSHYYFPKNVQGKYITSTELGELYNEAMHKLYLHIKNAN
jgi:hypothetical protein